MHQSLCPSITGPKIDQTIIHILITFAPRVMTLGMMMYLDDILVALEGQGHQTKKGYFKHFAHFKVLWSRSKVTWLRSKVMCVKAEVKQGKNASQYCLIIYQFHSVRFMKLAGGLTSMSSSIFFIVCTATMQMRCVPLTSARVS